MERSSPKELATPMNTSSFQNSSGSSKSLTQTRACAKKNHSSLASMSTSRGPKSSILLPKALHMFERFALQENSKDRKPLAIAVTMT